MQTIMTLIIDESEDIQESFLRVLLSALGQKKTVSTFPFKVFQ
jgi:sister-chromatid-cohesion protein PDS5